MKDKLLQIRVDEDFIPKIDYLCKINGYKNLSETIRSIVEKEFTKEKINECDLIYVKGEMKCDGTVAVICSRCRNNIIDYVDGIIEFCPICGCKIRK